MPKYIIPKKIEKPVEVGNIPLCTLKIIPKGGKVDNIAVTRFEYPRILAKATLDGFVEPTEIDNVCGGTLVLLYFSTNITEYEADNGAELTLFNENILFCQLPPVPEKLITIKVEHTTQRR